jgi:hypothetical protein
MVVLFDKAVVIYSVRTSPVIDLRLYKASIELNIQYWCIDGKYRIYVARLRNGEKKNL